MGVNDEGTQTTVNIIILCMFGPYMYPTLRGMVKLPGEYTVIQANIYIYIYGAYTHTRMLVCIWYFLKGVTALRPNIGSQSLSSLYLH